MLSGKVSVQTHPENDMSTITVVGLLQRGDTSGEIEVLTGSKRRATMVCKTQVEVVGEWTIILTIRKQETNQEKHTNISNRF